MNNSASWAKNQATGKVDIFVLLSSISVASAGPVVRLATMPDKQLWQTMLRDAMQHFCRAEEDRDCTQDVRSNRQ